MQTESLLKLKNLRSGRAVWLAGAIALSLLVAFHWYFFVQMAAALVVFTALWVPLLAVVFLLALLERAAELKLPRLKNSTDLHPARATAREVVAAMPGLGFRRRLMESFAELRSRGGKAAQVRSLEAQREWRRRENRDNDPRLRQGRRAA